MGVGHRFSRNKDRGTERLAHPEPHYAMGVRPPTPEEKKID